MFVVGVEVFDLVSRFSFSADCASRNDKYSDGSYWWNDWRMN